MKGIENPAVAKYLDELRTYRRAYQSLQDRSRELWARFDALTPTPTRAHLDGAGGSCSQSSAVERAVIQREEVWNRIKETDARIESMKLEGERLTDILLQMPYQERQTMIFRYVDGLTWDEVGKRTGMKGSRASYQCSKALATLADILAGHTRPKLLSFLIGAVIAG